MRSFVAYYRCSTREQFSSGLGLDAQRASVLRYIGAQGPLVAEFTEVESGNRGDRPELARALDLTRRYNAVLVIASLCRLGRSVAFVSALMNSGVEFVATDYPAANRLTVHILAAVAEEEARRISERTREALAAARQRGVKLGNPRGAQHLREFDNCAAVRAVISAANDHARRVIPIVEHLQASGAKSFGQIARALNEAGVPSPRGGIWHPASVRNAIARTQSDTQGACHQ